MMKKVYKLSFIYVLINLLSTLLVKHFLGITFGSPEALKTAIPFFLLQSLVAIYFYHKYAIKLNHHKGRYGWFLVIFIPLTFLTLFTLFHSFAWSINFIIPIIVAFLAAVNEEFFFRGTLFTSLINEKGLLKSIFISALIFSLLHSLNIFSGMPLSQVFIQLINTFMAGLFFSAMYYYTQNLSLMILYHWFWDYLPLSKITELYPNVIVIQVGFIVLEILITIILLYRFKNTLRDIK